uniref:Late blight resistance protein homolog R1A-10 n=1 Tax=Nicotiana tabacum TaxID=4097 RepID=A0A1S3ZMD8_TOBAC|nr:PREDICTED: putative late blight resistance protein homolog R1A-10 [Nicotiana tabacum]
MSSNRYLSSKNRLFERLQQLDDIFYFPNTTKDTVRFVKREFKFLDIFLSLQSFTYECPNMLDVVQKVQALFEDALFDFSELYLAEYFDLCPFIVQNKIWSIKMEIRAKYSFPKISSSPFSANKDGIAILNFFTKFIDTVVENLCDLVVDSCSLLYVPENKEHTEDVLKELKLVQYFVCFVSERFIEPQSQYHVSFFTHVLAVVGHASMLAWFYLSGRGYENQDVIVVGEINVFLFLQMELKPISTVIYPTIRKAFQSKLPRIHGLGYVDFLLNNLKEFQSRHSNSLASVTNQILIIQKELESLQPFLKAITEGRDNDLDKIHRCATQLIGKAYEVEYIVDACICKEAPVWFLERWLLDIIEEITVIRADVAKIQEKKMAGDTKNTSTSHASSSSASTPRMNEEIVGFKDVIEKLRDQLIKGTRGRDVISISGMPGLGKTTLAYRLYSDRLVVSHFDIRAQCCVSQEYSRKNLLLVILRDVIGKDSKSRESCADHELADELRRVLLSKRYLVLLDDVWEASAWDDLIGCFQDTNNGSRIIVTTRNNEVANYARFRSDPLSLRMFNDDESWELLRKKVFGEERCPPLLNNIGQQIAKKCGRLPLSIALVGGILAETEKKEECWEQVGNNLVPHIHGDSRSIIEHSYRILPYHIKLCFLYFGAFLEDSVINVSKLTRMWISEGFIKCFEGKSLEDIAEGYLGNLIGRNLVMGTKRSIGGKIKACRIHDLLHDFCKERAKKENLLLWIKRDQNTRQFSHRMSIYGERYHTEERSSCWSHVDSIILHYNCLVVGTVSHIFRSFKFLKVLDLEFTSIGSFPSDLVYLRYFAATWESGYSAAKAWKSSISSFTANRWNLETLILKGARGRKLPPITLCEMVKLRHLHIYECKFTIKNAEEYLENCKTLYDLRTLSYPCFSCVLDVEMILRNTPNLRELRCQVHGTKFYYRENFQRQTEKYYVLNFPAQLEMLQISRKSSFHIDENTLPFCISSPNLKNLRLEKFHLHPRHFSAIASLQNLKVLKLKYILSGSIKWKVSNGEFLQLEVLELDDLRIGGWIVEDDAFPNLQHLILLECKSLKEIPSCFGDISSLKSIKVEECNESVNKSARDIWNTQVEDYQNYGFEVFISATRHYYSYSDYED